MSNGLSIDIGSAYPFLEERVLSLFGKDASSSEWNEDLKKLVRISNDQSASIQCVGMAKPIPIADLYQPTGVIRPGGGGRDREQISVDDLIQDRADAIIFAGAGWGKTTLLHWIYQQTARSKDVVPLLFTLRQPDVFATFENFVRRLESGRSIKKRASILILVDGYDEIDREHRSRVSSLLGRYRTLGLGPFFLTCRSFYHVYDLKAPYFELAPFSRSDALKFIGSFSNAYGKRIDPDSLHSELIDHGLDQFAAHPLMLALVCILKAGPHASIPRSAIALIRKAIDRLTFSWDEAKGIKRSSNLPLDGEERVHCLMRIAYDMKALQGSWLDVEKSISRHVTLLQMKGIDRRILLQEIMQWYGLIVPAGDDNYQFVHRSIHDFLAARFWVESGAFGKADPDDWDIRAAYATCLIPDGTAQIQKMLRSGNAAFAAFRECLYNNVAFDMQAVAASVVERAARRGYTVREVGDVTTVTIAEDFFSVAKDDFLEALVSVASSRATTAGDAIAFCSLAEIYLRSKKVSRSALSGQLLSRLRDQPKRSISVHQSGGRFEVVFSLSEVIGFSEGRESPAVESSGKGNSRTKHRSV